MIFTPLEIDGAWIIDLEARSDERGFFARGWCSEEFGEHGIDPGFVQCNISFSHRTGTIRGLHYQRAPHDGGRLVRCIRGALFDVILDLRSDSPTRHQWTGVGIDASNHRSVYVPAGCAHGVQTLADGTEMLYMTNTPYSPEAEDGVRWNDPFFGIEWPLEPGPISGKDQSWPDFVAPNGAAVRFARSPGRITQPRPR